MKWAGASKLKDGGRGEGTATYFCIQRYCSIFLHHFQEEDCTKDHFDCSYSKSVESMMDVVDNTDKQNSQIVPDFSYHVPPL